MAQTTGVTAARVAVDRVVRDGKGRLVRDVKPGDLELLEVTSTLTSTGVNAVDKGLVKAGLRLQMAMVEAAEALERDQQGLATVNGLLVEPGAYELRVTVEDGVARAVRWTAVTVRP